MELTRENMALVTRIASRASKPSRHSPKTLAAMPAALQRIEPGEVPRLAKFARICLRVGMPGKVGNRSGEIRTFLNVGMMADEETKFTESFSKLKRECRKLDLPCR